MATNAELIQTMCVEDLNKFLFNIKTRAISSFFQSGGEKIMDAVQQKEWLESENHELLFEIMRGAE